MQTKGTTKDASQEAFQIARRRAFVQDLLAELSGRPENLLSFDEVSRHLHLHEPNTDPTLQDIPLDKIVGSVGRYRDFSRAFLPRSQVDPLRWTRIERIHSLGKLPPIHVFKVGEAYFVSDGNHRVSVARARGETSIKARVCKVPVRVPLGPDTAPDDLILKAGYAEFLERTALDRQYPDQRIELTKAGAYQSLGRHIEVHQYYMGLRSRDYPTLVEAAADWYCTVYLPVVERIRAAGILSQFPGRTEADLYLWVTENRASLQMRYGRTTEAHDAVADFAREHHVPLALLWVQRLIHRLFPRFLSKDSATTRQPRSK